MKRITSLLLAIVMLLSVLGTGSFVFAADAKTVDAQIKNGADFLLGNVSEFTVEQSADFLTVIRSGADVAKYKSGYADAVKKNLTDNGGKLVFSSYEYDAATGNYTEVKTENFGLTAAAILCLKELGYNPADFYKYNLTDYFSKMDLTKSKPNPYHYRLAIEAADEAQAKKICDAFIKDYYSWGKGMNYYGYSCDNTANFITALSPYRDEYKKYIENAKTVVQKYTKDNGAYCDEVYVKEVNANSTATALMAYASVGDLATAEKYYNWLVKGFTGSKPGVFKTDGKDNAYATKDALLALEYYKKALDEEDARIAAEQAKKEAIFRAIDESKPVITKITAGKKKARIVFDKVENASGYEIKYSTSKKFPAKKTKTVVVPYGSVKSYLFKGLKKKKKCYFKVRAYVEIDGKTVRGNWSKAKGVKTK